MNTLLQQTISNFWPAIILALGFPLVLLVLNESIAACNRSGLVLARTLRSIRNLVAPALALLIFVRHILELPQSNTIVRVIETGFWVLLLYALLGVVNDLVFGAARSDTWREKVPKLFRDLVRALLVALGAMVIYSQVWGREVEGALAALGVGSIVIGLALQEPLGNIVSGLMLLFERPLNVGDWVIAEGVTGRVIEINWRSVHIETPTRELQIIPNVSLYKGPFTNLSRPTTARTERIEIGFSYDDPPNRVKSLMMEILTTTEGVIQQPPPSVRTFNYADFSIIYRLSFTVDSMEDLPVIRDSIMTRIWYVVRREGLTIPFPIAFEYGPGESPSPSPPSPNQLLGRYPRFKKALKNDESEPSVAVYAAGETVQDAHIKFKGFALILEGRASLHSVDSNGAQIQIGEIGPGECFGDQLTAGASVNDIRITALEDLKIMIFENEVIGDLLNQSPSLADEIGDAIELRRQAVQSAKKVRS
ncbi:MAG: hypothetical protein RLZ22_1231 [Verrucomicrobiota bacterium]|jgi:small-conductance mechanosensitive channel